MDNWQLPITGSPIWRPHYNLRDSDTELYIVDSFKEVAHPDASLEASEWKQRKNDAALLPGSADVRKLDFFKLYHWACFVAMRTLSVIHLVQFVWLKNKVVYLTHITSSPGDTQISHLCQIHHGLLNSLSSSTIEHPRLVMITRPDHATVGASEIFIRSCRRLRLFKWKNLRLILSLLRAACSDHNKINDQRILRAPTIIQPDHRTAYNAR